MSLDEYVSTAASIAPDSPAVRGPDVTLSYGELDARANQIARALAAAGVRRGDRVGIWLSKSAGAVAAMQGVLRLGAAYVPVDPLSPVARARTILADCGVRALVARREAGERVLDDGPGRVGLVAADGWASGDWGSFSPAPVERAGVGPGDLAYILYTSGSTGRPKGVCITHSNAIAFVEWAVKAIGATEADRFANHAPLQFDLSVLDLYAAFAARAAVSLVPEGAAYAPSDLARFIRDENVTIWYSVPSAVVLMIEHGDLLSTPVPSLRVALFAGEAFPIKHLRRLRDTWPSVTMWNLYGPTETNVCTAYFIRSIAPSETGIPIGQAVCGDRVWARKDDGSEAAALEEGELLVQGPTVFPGYWGQPPRPVGAPYPTGDIVRLGADGNYHFVGRRDSMVKVRGQRVELGEIEAALTAHPSVREAATIVVGAGLSARLVACVGTGSEAGPTLLELKRHCAERLPRYMIPDDALCMPALPRNRNGKVDRRELEALVAGQGAP